MKSTDKAIATGFILLNSYAGLSKTPVEIIGKTPKKYRIRAVKDTKLAGRNRWIKAGDIALVPQHCVAGITKASQGRQG